MKKLCLILSLLCLCSLSVFADEQQITEEPGQNVVPGQNIEKGFKTVYRWTAARGLASLRQPSNAVSACVAEQRKGSALALPYFF